MLRHDVVGDLCAAGPPAGRVLQLLISGAGYGSLYWDFPFQPETYSYARAALAAGYATFNFDRPGLGRSARPFGLWLDVDRQAVALQQIIAALGARETFARVVLVGHSFGSVMAIAHGVRYPGAADGIILTGFAHNTNLHRDAQANFAIMLDWVARRVGGGAATGPSQPCVNPANAGTR